MVVANIRHVWSKGKNINYTSYSIRACLMSNTDCCVIVTFFSCMRVGTLAPIGPLSPTC